MSSRYLQHACFTVQQFNYRSNTMINERMVVNNEFGRKWNGVITTYLEILS